MIIEQIVYDYLSIELAPIKVFAKVPENPPKQFVVFEKTGGGGNLIKNASIVVQSYDESLFKTANLSNKVVEVMLNIATLPQIASVDSDGDYKFTDVQRKRERYQARFDISYYEGD